MLLVISVETEDKRSPIWLTVARLITKAGGITIFVFATSVFAAVALLALPMTQMLLTVIMGAGVFGRAITSGLVTAVDEEMTLMHLIASNKTAADQILVNIMKMQPEDSSLSYVLEVNGKLWVHQKCVGLSKYWKRKLLGLFAKRPSIIKEGTRVLKT